MNEIIVYGDKDKCEACESADRDFSKKIDHSEKVRYSYKSIDDDEAQKLLESRGVKDGEHINIPIIKVCKWEEKDGKKKKYCAIEEKYEEEKWKNIENGEFPDTLKFSLEE